MQRWDIFCKVVDNYGDIGTCWRLARQLAGEHDVDVRLWVDRLPSLARLCPTVSIDVDEQRVEGIEIRRWTDDFPNVEAADVVIEAFACNLPDEYCEAMVRRSAAPAWINLEYLSAEDWVEGCHRMASLRTKWPLAKYFFFPGFTPQTGGLLRERDLLSHRAAFDSAAEADFWRSVGVPARRDGELRVSMFCYENAALPELLRCWAEGDVAVTVLAMPGAAAEQAVEWVTVHGAPVILSAAKNLSWNRGSDEILRYAQNDDVFPARERLPEWFGKSSSLTVYSLPFLPQADFDRLLWACDVNFVRGEDSFVRAQWAGRPFIWQIYPQAAAAHLVKLEAFLKRYLDGFQGGSPIFAEAKIGTVPSGASDAVWGMWQSWNGGGAIASAWANFIANRRAIEQHGKVWASTLDQTGDLANNLVCFVRGL